MQNINHSLQLFNTRHDIVALQQLLETALHPGSLLVPGAITLFPHRNPFFARRPIAGAGIGSADVYPEPCLQHHCQQLVHVWKSVKDGRKSGADLSAIRQQRGAGEDEPADEVRPDHGQPRAEEAALGHTAHGYGADFKVVLDMVMHYVNNLAREGSRRGERRRGERKETPPPH